MVGQLRTSMVPMVIIVARQYAGYRRNVKISTSCVHHTLQKIGGSDHSTSMLTASDVATLDRGDSRSSILSSRYWPKIEETCKVQETCGNTWEGYIVSPHPPHLLVPATFYVHWLHGRPKNLESR